MHSRTPQPKANSSSNLVPSSHQQHHQSSSEHPGLWVLGAESIACCCGAGSHGPPLGGKHLQLWRHHGGSMVAGVTHLHGCAVWTKGVHRTLYPRANSQISPYPSMDGEDDASGTMATQRTSTGSMAVEEETQVSEQPAQITEISNCWCIQKETGIACIWFS